jgi:hypothetical protein
MIAQKPEGLRQRTRPSQMHTRERGSWGGDLDGKLPAFNLLLGLGGNFNILRAPTLAAAMETKWLGVLGVRGHAIRGTQDIKEGRRTAPRPALRGTGDCDRCHSVT